MIKQDCRVGDRVKFVVKNYTYVLEVVSLEERGAVCDVLVKREEGRWGNVGHRDLYEYSSIEKI